MNIRRIYRSLTYMLAIIICSVLCAGEVMAQTPPADLLDSCTQQPFFDYDNNPVNKVNNMLQSIIDEINEAVLSASENLFLAFTQDTNYGEVIGAAFMLMVIFFAISFMFGFINLTYIEGLTRIVKIGIVAWVASPSGIDFMNEYFVTFFNDGSAWLINAMINIASTGEVGTPSGSVAAPFGVLDGILNVVFSPRMFVTLIGTSQSGPFGIAVFFVLLWSIISIFMATLKALQIYAISIITKAVLFGLMPVFFPMILFARTKNFFIGWINMLVNFSLQPIFLFAFIAFFATLIESAARDILPPDDVHLCYVRAGSQAATPYDWSSWKFMCCDDGVCEPHEGDITIGSGQIGCDNDKPFPIDHVNILVFLLLTHIMKQLTEVAVHVASEISQAAMKLSDIPNAIGQWLGGAGGGPRDEGTDRFRFIKPQ